MRVEIGIGEFTITRAQQRGMRRVTASDLDALQAVVDTLALLPGGEEIQPHTEGLYIEAPTAAVADWLAFEVRAYIQYKTIEGMHDEVS